jgi:hypothetical protein
MRGLFIFDRAESRWVTLGVGYALFILLIAGYYNYTQPYDPNPVVNLLGV